MALSETSHIIVKYRNQPPSATEGRFFTGYSTIHQARRDENKEKCIIYQIPPEIVLSIMECLDAPSIYMARQTCFLMWSFFNGASFKSLHYVLKDKKGNIISGAPPGFKHDALDGHVSDIIKLLRSDQLCRDCRRGFDIREPDSFWRKPKACGRCHAVHERRYFSNDEERFCIAWEGKLKICPHRHISVEEIFRLLSESHFRDTRHVAYRCYECRDALGMGDREVPPTIYCRTQHVYSEWTIKVATLTKEQIVTMDLLRQSLKRIDSLLCPHARSSEEILMTPFCRRRCVCFRKSTGLVQRCYGHSHPRQRYDCCACLQVLSKDEAAVGMFMASTASHDAFCVECGIDYGWVLDEDRVMLSATRVVERSPYAWSWRIEDDVSFGVPRDLCDWIVALDPETYRGNVFTPKTTRCQDKGCRHFRLGYAPRLRP